MKIVIISGCVVVFAILGGAYAYVLQNTPAFSDVVNPCMLAEAAQSPGIRVLTCTCLFEDVSSPVSVIFSALSGSDQQKVTHRAALNTCRARAFEQGGDRSTPPRISPMPKLTN